MKSFKLIVILVCFLLCGSNFMNAQQLDASNSEQPVPNQVKSKTTTKAKAKARVRAKAQNRPVKAVNKNETKKLQSKSQKAARALTAKKTKDSGKGNIPPEKAKKERAARIAAIIETNKTKKKTLSKRKNNN